MNRFTSVGMAIVLAVFSVVGAMEAYAEELSVARYISLSIARLQLAKGVIERENRGVTTDEEAALLQGAETTAEEYYAFASTHPEEVEAYLAAHATERNQIESLSAAIRTLAAQLDTRPQKPPLPR